MKFASAWIGKDAFSDREKAGQKAISNGEFIEPLLRWRLKAPGFMSNFLRLGSDATRPTPAHVRRRAR